MIHYQEAIKLQPYYADAYYNRGNVLFAKGHVDEAIADWEKTLQIQPNDPDATPALVTLFCERAHYTRQSPITKGR